MSRQPNAMVMQMIKNYAIDFLNDNDDNDNILYSSKAFIENNKGFMLNHKDIINKLSKKPTFDWIWKITDNKYCTTKHLSKDGYECYELIMDINGWNAILVILPPNPSKKQINEWNKIDNFISKMSMRYVMW